MSEASACRHLQEDGGTVISVQGVRFAFGLALIAALTWAALIGVPAIEEAQFRSDLRTNGVRLDVRVAEAGFERPDGTLLEIGVNSKMRGNDIIGIDLRESDIRVRAVGDQLRVVVPSLRYHRGLPEDVVDRSVVPYLMVRFAPPGVVIVLLLIGLVITRRRTRSSEEHD